MPTKNRGLPSAIPGRGMVDTETWSLYLEAQSETKQEPAFSRRELDFIKMWVNYGIGSLITAEEWKRKLSEKLQVL